ncbi:DUF1566 domain-containing protein [Ectothiorhodospiraceae bacterium BW-2]|nr:DUF1566 domain-containing protein [Ectothiorhodospiraceae bacterium BW-2]
MFPATVIIALLMLLPLSLQAVTCNNSALPPSTPDSQFTVHGDGTVTDTVTGLMWKQCVEGLSGGDCSTGSAQTFTWQGALQRPASLNVGGGFAGYTDWRLPNLNELLSLVETCRNSPAINNVVFPNTPSSYVWSASANANVSDFAWRVYFNNGNSNNNFRPYSYGVRLVRSGQ